MAPKGNRIEVDLRVMQEEAIQRLERFGKDFDNTVDRLVDLLESTSQKVSGSGGGGGGTISSNASTSAGTDQAMQGAPQARLGGSDFANQPPGTGTGTGHGSGGASNSETVEDQFVRLQRRIGSSEMAVPSSLRQALGYAAEGQLNLNPIRAFQQPMVSWDQYAQILSDVNSDPQFKGASDAAKQAEIARRYKQQRNRSLLGATNDFLFNFEASKAMAMRGMHKYNAFGSSIQGISSYGYATAPNTGTGGILGTSLGSGSFWHGLHESTWAPLVSSTFGLDLGYSLGQAQEARQTINSYGWSSGNMGNWLATVLKENTKRFQLDPKSQMAFLDPMLRWGGWQSFGQLNAVLGSIASAAQAAGMNLNQFTQELVQTSMQVAQQTGNTPGTVAGVLSDFSAVTGLAPQQGADLLSTQNIMMAAAYTGKNPWDIYTGKDQGATLAMPLTRFQQMLGMPVDSFLKLAHGNAADRATFKSRMWQMTMLYSRDPQIFGGISPLQLMDILKRNGGTVSGVMRHMQIQGRLTNLNVPANSQGVPLHPAAVDARIEHLMHRYAPGSQGDHMVALYQEWLRKNHHETSSMQMRKHQAEQIIRGSAHNRQLRAARKVTIELSGDAKKYFQLQGDPGHQNNGSDFGRKAMTVAHDIFHPISAAEDIYGIFN